jgi:hypothetical protein
MAKATKRDVELLELRGTCLKLRQDLEHAVSRLKLLEEREQGWVDAILKLKGVKL